MVSPHEQFGLIHALELAPAPFSKLPIEVIRFSSGFPTCQVGKEPGVSPESAKLAKPDVSGSSFCSRDRLLKPGPRPF